TRVAPPSPSAARAWSRSPVPPLTDRGRRKPARVGGTLPRTGQTTTDQSGPADQQQCGVVLEGLPDIALDVADEVVEYHAHVSSGAQQGGRSFERVELARGVACLGNTVRVEQHPVRRTEGNHAHLSLLN